MVAKVSGARHMSKAKAKTGKAKLGKLGSGRRFAAIAAKGAKKYGKAGGAALAAFLGRKKWGAKKFAALGAKGRKRASKGK